MTMAAVSSMAAIFSSILYSKLPSPSLYSLSSQQLHLPKITHSKWTPLVSTYPTPSSSLMPCLTNTNNNDLLPMIYPSLAYAKTLCFKSGFNVQINVEPDEPEDKLILRFKRAVIKAGVLRESKRRRFFENSQDKKKRKARDAARRNRKRRPYRRVEDKQEAPKQQDLDEDDNWELPEGDLP